MLALLVAAALGVLPFLGGTFMPDFREGHFVMQVSSAVPGTSLDQMLEVGARISAEVLAPRGELKALAMGRRDTHALKGWRRAEIGERLLAALS